MSSSGRCSQAHSGSLSISCKVVLRYSLATRRSEVMVQTHPETASTPSSGASLSSMNRIGPRNTIHGGGKGGGKKGPTYSLVTTPVKRPQCPSPKGSAALKPSPSRRCFTRTKDSAALENADPNAESNPFSIVPTRLSSHLFIPTELDEAKQKNLCFPRVTCVAESDHGSAVPAHG